MQTITKTNDSVTVTTPQFHVTIPGTWIDDDKPSEDVIYAGKFEDNGISKHLLVSHFDLRNGSDPEGSRFEGFVSGFRQTEKEVTHNQARIVDIPVHSNGSGMSGGHIGIHPSAGRVVFSQAFGNDVTAYNVYYELEGFTSAPDVSALYTEFRMFAESAQFAEQEAAANP